MLFFKDGVPALQIAVEKVTLSAGEFRFEVVVREKDLATLKPFPLYEAKFRKPNPGFEPDGPFEFFGAGMDVARWIEQHLYHEFGKRERAEPTRRTW